MKVVVLTGAPQPARQATLRRRSCVIGGYPLCRNGRQRGHAASRKRSRSLDSMPSTIPRGLRRRCCVRLRRWCGSKRQLRQLRCVSSCIAARTSGRWAVGRDGREGNGVARSWFRAVGGCLRCRQARNDGERALAGAGLLGVGVVPLGSAAVAQVVDMPVGDQSDPIVGSARWPLHGNPAHRRHVVGVGKLAERSD